MIREKAVYYTYPQGSLGLLRAFAKRFIANIDFTFITPSKCLLYFQPPVCE